MGLTRRILLKTPILAAVGGLCPAFLRRVWASPERVTADDLYLSGRVGAPPPDRRRDSEGFLVARDAGADPPLELEVEFHHLWQPKDSTQLTGYIVFNESRAKVLKSRNWDWFALLRNYLNGTLEGGPGLRPEGPWNSLTCELALLDHRLCLCLFVDSAGVHIVPESEWTPYPSRAKAIILPRDWDPNCHRIWSPGAGWRTPPFRNFM